MNLIEKPIIENNDFIIYGNADLNIIKIKLIEELSNKKKELLNFFRLNDFPKVTINLFNDHDVYLEFTKQFFEPMKYSYGNFANGMINYTYDKTYSDKNFEKLISKIMHEYIHILYKQIYKDKFDRVVWLDEGLAQYLSGQFDKQQDNEEEFKNWFLDNIIRRDKEIPKIDYLKKHGSKYGEFVDQETNKYSGYSISYLLVKYLFDNYDNIYDIISDKEKIDEIETNIIEKSIKYYDRYKVKDSVDDVNTTEELLNYMNKNILYGWIDKDKKQHINNMINFRQEYKLESIDEIKKNKIGTCIEQTLLEKYWFDKHNIQNKIFCHRLFENEENFDKEVKMHCFLLYYLNNKWYHFEHSNQPYRGIHEYNSLDDFYTILSKHYCEEGKIKILSEFDYPNPGITFKKFNDFVNQFNNIDLNNEKKF